MTNSEPRRERALKKIRPGGGPDDFDRWQQRKGSMTRQAILEATVDSVVEAGYAGMSTNDVCRRAGISRGAMHHHFPSRADLVVGVIEHVFYKRMQHFLDQFMAELKLQQTVEKTPKPEVIAVELHWNSIQTKEFSAYLRLAVAARSDPELQVAFYPAAKRFDEVWTEEMVHTFPQWKNAVDMMQLASDLTSAVHIGMLVNGHSWGDGRMERVQDEVRDIVHRLALRIP